MLKKCKILKVELFKIQNLLMYQTLRLFVRAVINQQKLDIKKMQILNLEYAESVKRKLNEQIKREIYE